MYDLECKLEFLICITQKEKMYNIVNVHRFCFAEKSVEDNDH